MIILSFNTIGCVGYGLYLWGGEDLEFSKSAWTAFKTWLTFGIGSIVACVVGGFLTMITD